jgi:hypothetical protein
MGRDNRDRTETKRSPEEAKAHAERDLHKSMKYDSSNAQYAQTSEMFRAACDEAGVQPTKRQASKFRRGIGAAYTRCG